MDDEKVLNEELEEFEEVSLEDEAIDRSLNSKDSKEFKDNTQSYATVVDTMLKVQNSEREAELTDKKSDAEIDKLAAEAEETRSRTKREEAIADSIIEKNRAEAEAARARIRQEDERNQIARKSARGDFFGRLLGIVIGAVAGGGVDYFLNRQNRNTLFDWTMLNIDHEDKGYVPIKYQNRKPPKL